MVGVGWCVLGEPDEYDGTNYDVLTPFVIYDQCLNRFIEVEDQLPLKNIGKVKIAKETINDGNNPNLV